MGKGLLYVGIDPKYFVTDKPLVHCPLVEVVARPADAPEVRDVFTHLDQFTHIIFTSKSAVKIFFSYFRLYQHAMDELKKKYIIAVGRMTALYLQEEEVIPTYIANEEAQSGVIRVLSSLDLQEVNILLPRSSAARPQLAHFLVEHDIRHQVCTLYDMYKKQPVHLPDLHAFDEVVFATPVDVEEFFALYPVIPEELAFHPMGIYTREALRKCLAERKMEGVYV